MVLQIQGNLVPAPEFKEGVDVEPKVDESEDGGEDMDMEAKVLESELDASKVEEPEESSEIEKRRFISYTNSFSC